MKGIIEFSDRNNLRESGSLTWERVVTEEEASSPQSFVAKVMNVLSDEVGKVKALEFMPSAIYPNRLERNIDRYSGDLA